MNHLKPEEWDRLFEVLQGIRDGKTIQWWNEEPNEPDEWLDDKPVITDLVRFPLRYRVKPEPETITIYVYRPKTGTISATTNPNLCALEGWELLYSFEHEVQA